MEKMYFYILLLLLSFGASALLTGALIPKLKKSAKQPIYNEGPTWHMKKSGTPTMGGIGFIIPVCLCISVLAALYFINGDEDIGISLALTVLFCFANALVGVADDTTKLKRSENGGLTPKQKLVLQGIISIAYLAARAIMLNDGTEIYLGKISLDMGILYYPFALLFLLGMINCANLTDGIDGLASSVSFTISAFTFAISLARFSDSTAVSAVALGGILGFILFNIHPAKIFMGDTGSLFLGAIAASYAFSTKSLIAYLLIGIVYVIEGASVILQVTHFKATGKRIFKMAPLHHHLEKCGFDESTICLYAILATFACSLFASVIIGG